MERKNEVLLVLPEVPYPMRAQGISIRYLPIIEELSKSSTLDIIIIGKNQNESQYVDKLHKYFKSVTIISHPDPDATSKLKKFITRVKFFLPWSLPRSWITYGSEAILKQVDKATAGKYYDSVVCVSGYNYPYIKNIQSREKVIDFIDSPTLLAKRNVIGSTRNYLIRKYEQWKTYYWEAAIIRKSNKAIYISDYDAAIIHRLFAPVNKRHVIPNGFVVDDYSDSTNPSVKGPSIGFFGNMSYFPNVEAALWLTNKVFRDIKERLQDLNLYIIGRDPDEAIRHLHNGKDIHVTGEVDVIWPFINSLDILVFPLMRGAGLKNKILEAMYSGKLVITTKIGNEGINGIHNKHLLICETENEFKTEIIKYIEEPAARQEIADNGKIFVEKMFAWPGILNKYKNIVLN